MKLSTSDTQSWKDAWGIHNVCHISFMMVNSMINSHKCTVDENTGPYMIFMYHWGHVVIKSAFLLLDMEPKQLLFYAIRHIYMYFYYTHLSI